jgi:hypothetical protein
MNSKVSLALCMWQTRVQIPDKLTHVILSFSPEGKFEIRVPNLKNTGTNTKEVVYNLFGFSDPPKLSGEIPKPSFKQWIKDINPFNFFNSKYISLYAILPRNLDEVYSCSEITPDQLKLGLIDDYFQTITAKMEIDEEQMDHYMKLLGSACVQFICFGFVQKELKKTLTTLLTFLLSRFSYNQENKRFSPN